MELKDTVAMMCSEDYKERFKAEYYQLKIRHDKLKAMCDKWDRKEINFTPTCPRVIYKAQIQDMSRYMKVLERRSKIEGIELTD